MKNILKYIGLILGLFVIGFLIRDYFYEFSFLQLNVGNTLIVNQIFVGQFNSHILFALSIGLIPLLYLILKTTTNFNFKYQGFISSGIIIVCGIILWQFRIFQLNNQFQKLSEFQIENGIQTTMNFENLNFEHYLSLGFLIGAVLSILIFKNRTKKIE